MEDPAEIVGRTLAANLRAARRARGWRLDDVASRSGVSRGMLQQIETGRTNPSIATLARICAVLGTTIGRLVEPPEELGRVVPAADAEVRKAGRESRARLLINDGDAPFIEFWDFTIASGDEIGSPAHPAGTRELIQVHEGDLTVDIGGATFEVGPGDALRMRGDRDHTYRNPGFRPVRLTMAVVYSGDRDPRYAPS
jgi:transcriptional regulator with XRE-family HTH domain